MFKTYFLSILMFGYLLGIHNGQIALWQGDDPKPVYIFPCTPELLPVEDQNLLRRGVAAKNTVELTKLLEDYLS